MLRLAGTHYDARTARLVFADDATECLAAVPGVAGVSVANFVPFYGSESAFPVATADQPASADSRSLVTTTTASANYFAEMKIALKRGRTFNATDAAGSALVAIINEEMARTYWPGRDPIGDELSVDSRLVDGSPRRVIGIVADVRSSGNTLRVGPQLYLPYAQEPYPFVSFVVRVPGNAPAMATVLKHEVASVDPTQIVTSVVPIADMLAQAQSPRRFVMSLTTALAGLALTLAVIGLAAVIWSSVVERTKEIGIRMTLGASPASIVRIVVGQAGWLAGIGVAAGIGIATATTRYLAEMLYGVKPLDFPTFAASAGIMMIVAIVASAMPARRAARVDPLIALRAE
jgi:putative ABC transport system permease protein